MTEQHPSRPVSPRWARNAALTGLIGLSGLSGLSGLLAGCAAPPLPSGGENQLLNDVKAGRVQLDCGLGCSGSYIFNRQAINQLYRSSKWPELAVAVARTGWRHDITYYYLGAAAEGMGALDAADRYYRMAGALATGQNTADKCISVQNLCDGLVFPRDIQTRLRAIANAQGRRNLAEAASNPGNAAAPGAAAASSNDDFIPDAPQALLARYAAQRFYGGGTGNAKRDLDFGNAALELIEPATAASTRNNEIARPRAVAALKDRLGNEVAEPRVVLGIWVQLKEYDRSAHAFPLRYPSFGRGTNPNLNGAVFQASNGRGAGARGYTLPGSSCVWEPGNEFARPDLPDAQMLLMSACVQHPGPQQRYVQVQTNVGNELPPLLQLMLPREGLWPRLPLDEVRAEQLIQRIGPQRMVWAELVLDVRASGPVLRGPFGYRDVIEQSRFGMQFAVQPRALVVWDQAPDASRAGRVLAMLGDVDPRATAPTGRLPRTLVADRSYDDQPLPADWTRSSSTAAASDAPSRPKATPPRAPAPVPTPAKPAKSSDDDDAWIEPPPAKR